MCDPVSIWYWVCTTISFLLYSFFPLSALSNVIYVLLVFVTSFHYFLPSTATYAFPLFISSSAFPILRPSSTHFLLFILQDFHGYSDTFAANNTFYTNYLICCKHVSFVAIRSDVHQRFSTGVFLEYYIFTRTQTQHEAFHKDSRS